MVHQNHAVMSRGKSMETARAHTSSIFHAACLAEPLITFMRDCSAASAPPAADVLPALHAGDTNIQQATAADADGTW